jgi:hypothetical protein
MPRLISVTVFGGIGQSRRGSSDLGASVAPAHEQARRPAHSGRLATGTLACGRCDAPVAIGADPLSLTDQLTCPFCHSRGPVRDFLSLASPTRPARVVVLVGLPARAG